MSNFFTDVIQKDSRLHSTARCHDLQMLEPNMRRKVQAILADAHAHGVEYMVWETFRSQERQAQLFEQGATELRRVGVHHYGLACDLVKSINGEPSWKGDFSLLRHLAHAHGLVSGADWPTFPDEGHIQLCKVSDQAKLFRGEWYPDASYVAYAGSA